MSSQYKVCALYWSYHDGYYLLKHQGELEDLLNDGWEISRVDTMSQTNFPSGAFGATNVYVLEKQSKEKQSKDMKKSSVLDLLPHDFGLRVELDTNETYYLQSGWKECDGGIYGFACGYASSGNQYYAACTTWFDEPGCIAIMSSHVKLAVSFDEHETETTRQNEDTNMKETNR